jgi:nucleoside-diphosphate-sugar epimerase
MSERFLVTGALGCIGAWTCALLAEEGVDVVGYDLGSDDRRIKLATDREIPLERGDISDGKALAQVLDRHEITHVVHLAALLLTMIKRDPPYGTAVNIGGTVNVLDAAKTRGIQVAYASSAAVYSNADATGAPIPNDAQPHPDSFYGVHKLACENLARVFWEQEQVPSIGIRPFVVYGPGRDAGLTASPTLAMAAAAAGESAQIAFGGRTQMQYAPDTARVFIAAARAATAGSSVYHLGGAAVPLAEVAASIERAAPGVSITVDESTTLPFPEEFEGTALDTALGDIAWTPLDQGVAATVERLRAAR